jgi:uncharacterized membrane protein
MDYVIVKWLHILSSTLLYGLGLGTAFHFFIVSRGRDARATAAVARSMVLADWLFTASTIVFQPLSGFYLMHAMQLSFSAPWIAWSVALYLVAGACWLPVVWIQLRLRHLATVAVERRQPLPPAFWYWRRVWIALGVPAFVSLTAVFYLMVAKPS